MKKLSRNFCRAFVPCLLLCGAFCLVLPLRLWAGSEHVHSSLDFSLFKMGSGAPVVLVVGGIQGDEPGGFSAATLLATRYSIASGTVWVVPNLNFPSIIKRSRGIHGDMNRKFATLAPEDPEYSTVSRIQGLIRAPEVCLVLNLHDGSGYFRPKYENALCNASRWGQAVIIDQENMDDASLPLGRLGSLAAKVTGKVNTALLRSLHKYHVRNTRTAQGDREMEKSLSYYALRHGKAAFGLEASKEFAVDMRAYYHLQLIEGFLREAGVAFSRDFALSPAGVAAALQSDLSITFAGKVLLPLEDVRPYIGYLPLPRTGSAAVVASKPIMAVVPGEDTLNVQYGNRTMTRIRPDWREMDQGLDRVRLLVDGEEKDVDFGQVVPVRQAFAVRPLAGYRVNVIGVDSGKTDESDMSLTLSHFQPRFSVDRSATLYRVEIYKNAAFAGMFLVRFGSKIQSASRDALPAVVGTESRRGR